MMNFFRLLDDVRISGRWHLGEVFERGTQSPLELWKGIPARCELPLSMEITCEGISLDFCLTSFAVPVAFKGIGEAISSIANRDLQRLPLEIRGHTGFEVLNSVRVIKCLDEEHSEFTKWTQHDHRADLAGQYRMVTKLKIESSQVPPDAHFFRIEGWCIALIISEEIKSAFEKIGCRGALFQIVT